MSKGILSHELKREVEAMSENILSNKLTRRTFLKAAAATAAVAAIGDKLFGGPVSTLVESAAAAPAVTEDKWIPSTCDICDEVCGIMVHRVDGVVVKVDGHPKHPRNQGRLCGRPTAYPMYLYNPYRVKAPMKRTNPEKGLGVDPQWVEISWDEALDTVADKLKAARQEDPNTYWPHTGHRNLSSLSSNFARAFGTGNTLGSVNFCTGGALHFSSYMMTGLSAADVNIAYTNWTMQMGGRHLGQKGSPLHNRVWSQAKDRGIKTVELCPIVAPSDPNPDEWLPIKPGTDAAFFLAMINVTLHGLGVYDVEFVKKKTNAPYLIQIGGAEDGLYMRAEGTGDELIEDHIRLNQKFGKPLMWDPVDGKPKVYDDPTFKDFALEGTYTVKWKDMPEVECKPAFQLLKEHVKKYTPEYAEEITTIPAQTIRRITKEFVEAAQIGSTIAIDGVEFAYRPAAIGFCKALSGSRGLYTQFTLRVLNTLVGAIDCPGGMGDRLPDLTQNPADGLIELHSFIYEPIKFPPTHCSMRELYPVRYNTNTLAWYAINEPDKYYLQHPCKIYSFLGCNILGNSFSPVFVAEQLKKIPFIFGMPYHFDDIAQMADVLLPPNSHLEQYNTPRCRMSANMDVSRYNMAWIQQPVVKTVFNTKHADDIFIELAERVGILYGEGGLNDRTGGRWGEYKLDLDKKYTWEEMFDRNLKSTHGDNYGLDYFKEHGHLVLTENTAADLFGAFLKWPTTRMPFYMEYLVWCGRQHREEYEQYKDEFSYRPSNEYVLDYYKPLPDYFVRPYEEFPAEYNMYAVHYKTMLHSMATFMDNAWITEHTQRYDPYTMNILIHPEAAKKRGIKNGDLMWVESPFGKTKGEAAVTHLTRPDTVAIAGLFGPTSVGMYPPAREGPLFNNLCWASEEWRDPITGNQENTMKVKVYKA